jgi:hypothetical protein
MNISGGVSSIVVGLYCNDQNDQNTFVRVGGIGDGCTSYAGKRTENGDYGRSQEDQKTVYFEVSRLLCGLSPVTHGCFY